MASDRDVQKLTQTIEELVKQLKYKNSYGSGGRFEDAVRLGRKGDSNAKSVKRSIESIDTLADELVALQKSMTSGGKSLSTYFKDLVKKIDPLRDAFDKLEDVVDKVAIKQGKIFEEAAKQAKDYIKEQKGNVDKIRELNDDYGEMVQLINELVALQKNTNVDQVEVNEKLKKIYDKRTKLEAELTKGKNILPGGGVIDKFLKRLSKDYNNFKVNGHVAAQLGKELEELTGNFKAASLVMNTFLTSITKTVKDSEKEFSQAMTGFSKSLGGAVVKEAKLVPGFITSRLRYGFDSNEFLEAFRMGLSAEEFNQFRAANRDVLNSLTNFGKSVEDVSTGTLRVWSNQAKQVGLIGQEAAEFTSNMMRTAYNSGRKFDEQVNQSLIDSALLVQQAFGGSIQDASKVMQDYTTQIYNLQKFNNQQTVEQQAALQKELATRLLLTKYMGYDIEYMKQQEMMRHNASFSDIADRIRGAVMGELAGQTLGQQLGWSQSDMALFSKSRRPGVKLTGEEIQRVMVLQSQVSANKQQYEAQASSAGDIAGFAGALLPNIVQERFIQGSGGDTLQAMTDADIAARAQRRARGEISFEDYVKTLEANAETQKNSVSAFDTAVLQFSEAVRGFGGMPGAALAGAVGGLVSGVGKALITQLIGKRLLGTVTGRGAAGILGRVGIGGFGAGATAGTGTAGAGAAAGLGTAAAGVLGAAAAGAGLGYLGYKGGSAAYNSDSQAKKALALSNPLTALGYAGTGISSYFADKNHEKTMSIADRVASTGQFTDADIEEFTRQRLVGDWWVTDDDRANARQSAVNTLNQIASYTRNKNATAMDRQRSTAISVAADSAVGVQRDEFGNPIPQGGGKSIEEQSLEVQKRQLDLMEQEKQEQRQRDERENAIASKQQSVQEHMANLGETYRGMFTVSAA